MNPLKQSSPLLSPLNNNHGFTMLAVALSIVLVPTMVLVATQQYSMSQKTAALQHSTSTKNNLVSVKNYLITQATDIDSDTYTELLKEGTSNTIPASVPIRATDDWGGALRYYTWDLGTVNSDTTYSQNNVAPPLTNLIGRIISAGSDGVISTTATNTTPQGDDIVYDIFTSDVAATYDNSGWTEEPANNRVTLKTPGRWVGIGTTTPQSRLDVTGAVARTGTHATSQSLYVTGTMGSGNTGTQAGNVEFRHDNGTQGIGFGYNTIYQAGTNTNQDLNFLSKGNMPITLNAFPYSTGNVGIGTSLGIGTTTPESKLHVANDGYATFGPNSTWGARLRIGGNGNVDNYASVATTNGNLHIDAQTGGFGVNINYYKGTGGVNFGNGAGGFVASIGANGNFNTIGTISPSNGVGGYIYADGNGIRTTSNLLSNGNIYWGSQGVWLSNYLNQNVRSDSSPTFSSVTATTFNGILEGYGSSPDNSHPGHGIRPFYSWNTGQAYNPTDGFSNGITIGSHPGDQSYGFQIVQNMWDDQLYFRRYNAGWQGWRTVMDTTNFNSYAPTLTGGGASGTWAISITGNADTVDGYHFNQPLLTTSAPTFAGLTVTGASTFNSSGTYLGQNYFYSNKGNNVYLQNSDNAGLQAFANDGSSAFMSFHRGGYYAINMGLDPDNAFRIGGWSDGAQSRITIDTGGNLYTRGVIYPTGGVGGALYADGDGIRTTSNFLANGNIYWGNKSIWLTDWFNQATLTTSSPTFSTVYTNNWFRSNGNSGWYNETYAGGIYMTDSTWVRTYNGKSFRTDGTMSAGAITSDSTITSGGAITSGGTLAFTQANPTISTGGSFITVPSGMKFTGGTVQSDVQINANGGIKDTLNADLTLKGGQLNNTNILGTLSINGTQVVANPSTYGNYQFKTYNKADIMQGSGKVDLISGQYYFSGTMWYSGRATSTTTSVIICRNDPYCAWYYASYNYSFGGIGSYFTVLVTSLPIQSPAAI